ncbi:MAG: radical SAM protein [Theionarchaea archaeon]|nr:radical SAM protein [Theionarchaea archaeon]
MILHCTPPYWQSVPNAPLGYLKGFLEAEGIPVTNVYWNVILSKRIQNFQKDMGDHAGAMESFPSEFIIFYICKQLLAEDSKNFRPTTSDQLFSSLYSKEELFEALSALKDDIDRYIKQNNLYDVPLSGFTLKTYQWLMSLYLIRRLKEMNPDIKVVLGGIYNRHQARAFMKVLTLADFAIWGEGEYPLLYLAKALEDGTDIVDVPHLVYRDDKKILLTGNMQEYPPLDEYPFADHSDYFRVMKKFDPFDRSFLVPIWGSRACNWNKCKFCALNEGYAYRVRSPENIVEEIEYQSKKFRVDEFLFTDSDIAGNKKRFKTLLNLLMQSIRERRRPYRLCAEISPLFIDEEMVKYMKRAGFCEVQAGFEAVADSLLQKMQKRQKMVHNIQALKCAHQHNLYLKNINIMRGIPTETKEDIAESCTNLKFLRFFLHKCYLEPIVFFLIDRSPFYNEMSEADKEQWKENLLWEEVAPLHLIPEADRFKFFSFYQNRFNHYHLWNNFEDLVKFYREQQYSYEWIETPDGSVVEEKGFKSHRYTLGRNETDLLIFCDSIKLFSELKKEFSHLNEEELRSKLATLKDAGLLYYDKESNSISVLDATKKL